MPYTHFQYIAYETPTFGVKSAALPAGDLCDAVKDIPVPQNLGLSDDSMMRLRRLAAVVDEAYNNIIGDKDSTLKIFMAPEFYFRPQEADNNYSYSQAESGKILASLGTMFKNHKFENWLIVPGTIIANISKDPISLPSKGYYYYNTAIVIKGGKNCKIIDVEKQQPSNIDNIPIYGGIANPNVPNGEYLNYYQSWDVRKKRVFMLDGIQMGLDICLDHLGPSCMNGQINDNLRVTKRVCNELSQKNQENSNISLHLLTAGGMPIVKESVAAKNNGYILRTDGHPRKVGGGSKAELKRINKYTKAGVNTTSYDMTVGNPTPDGKLPNCSVADLTDISPNQCVPLKGKLNIPINGADNPDNMTQSIIFFPEQPLR